MSKLEEAKAAMSEIRERAAFARSAQGDVADLDMIVMLDIPLLRAGLTEAVIQLGAQDESALALIHDYEAQLDEAKGKLNVVEKELANTKAWCEAVWAVWQKEISTRRTGETG